jgi:hypothetical protein
MGPSEANGATERCQSVQRQPNHWRRYRPYCSAEIDHVLRGQHAHPGAPAESRSTAEELVSTTPSPANRVLSRSSFTIGAEPGTPATSSTHPEPGAGVSTGSGISTKCECSAKILGSEDVSAEVDELSWSESRIRTEPSHQPLRRHRVVYTARTMRTQRSGGPISASTCGFRGPLASTPTTVATVILDLGSQSTHPVSLGRGGRGQIGPASVPSTLASPPAGRSAWVLATRGRSPVARCPLRGRPHGVACVDDRDPA